MEVFIHEDYVKKRNEVRREQRRKQMLQMEQGLGNHGVSRPVPERQESPRVPAQYATATPTGGPSSPSTLLRSPTARATVEEAASSDHRLFDSLKPY